MGKMFNKRLQEPHPNDGRDGEKESHRQKENGGRGN